jgi:hypothetical protein
VGSGVRRATERKKKCASSWSPNLSPDLPRTHDGWNCARRQRTLSHCARCFTCFTEYLTRLPLLVVPRPSWGISGSGPGVLFLRCDTGFCALPMPHGMTWWAPCVDFVGQKRRAVAPLMLPSGMYTLSLHVGRKDIRPTWRWQGYFLVEGQASVFGADLSVRPALFCSPRLWICWTPPRSPFFLLLILRRCCSSRVAAARLASPSLPSAHLPCRIPQTVWHRWSWLLLLRTVEVGSSSVVLLVDVLPISSDLLPLHCF